VGSCFGSLDSLSWVVHGAFLNHAFLILLPGFMFIQRPESTVRYTIAFFANRCTTNDLRKVNLGNEGIAGKAVAR
jgi:hypothetical protein